MTDTASTYQGPQRVFSGVQPTGDLHLGNYLGALKKFADLQHDHECLFCVVDQHAITVAQDPKKLADQTRTITAAYLAAGVDPSKAIIYAQSSVPAHTELAWYFNCTARVGWLARMTQFKDKAGKNAENSSVGLYAYPNLMAADILTYCATHVPVGEDQKQHLELARDIAQKFNNDFAKSIKQAGFKDGFFPQPEPMILGEATRVMSLKDGSKKMSKSDPSDLSRLNLLDDAETIARKVKKARTDPDALPSEAKGLTGRPEAANLVSIYAALNDQTKADVLSEYGGQQFSVFKPALVDLAVEKLGPMVAEMKRLMDDKAYIDDILAKGGEQARATAEPILQDVKRIVGFIRAK